MVKKSPADQEFDEKKAEAQVEISALMEEYGYNPVIAACQQILNSHVHENAREEFRDENHD